MTDTPGPRLRVSVEVVATVLLAVAAVATAWCSYQATRWNGEQAKASAAASATRFQATRSSQLANSQTEVDVATFSQWVDAYARNEQDLADFYRKRFRAEFQPAVEAWIATRPLKNPGAPLTPFAMPEYKLAASAEADRLDREAEALAATVRNQIQNCLELRSRGRPVRGRALLRRHQHEAVLAPAAGGAAQCRLHRLPRDHRVGRDLPHQPVRLTAHCQPGRPSRGPKTASASSSPYVCRTKLSSQPSMPG